MKEAEIIIYKEKDGQSSIQVKLIDDSIWLSQKQMSELFDKDSDTIGLHLKNIYSSGELIKEATTEYFSVIQKEGNRQVKRKINFYNLDAIISVGYRVNSKKGTMFRIWATNILKQHILKGYSINNSRLTELKQSIKLIQTTVENSSQSLSQTTEIVKVLTDFALGLDILDGYDHQNLEIKATNSETKYKIKYSDAKNAIEELRIKFGGSNLFGNEKDESFKSSISTINQTFGGIELYSSVEEKAANLLYFVVKNHSFTDGNKRIAAWLFIWYLNKNESLYTKNGKKIIENNALASITLMVALSKPEEKDLVIKVIINTINKLNAL